ncbi:MAG: hypothetical protein ACRYGF_14715 [Janthinobacterium lividum]
MLSFRLRGLRGVAYLFLHFIVLSYMGLVALGRWQLDEYVEFYRMRTVDARHYLLDRLTWSPRPISEVLFCSYGWMVNHFHHPLIIPLLSGLWVVFLAAGYLTYWLRRRHASAEDSWPSLLVALTLMALFLAGGHTTEVFYWPAGAVAYIPTLAATLLLFLQVIEGRLDIPQGRLIASSCLIVAAGSSEAGAAFVVCYALIQFFQRVRKVVGRRDQPDLGSFLWYAIPAFVASTVLLAVRLHRFRAPEVGGTAAVAGHPLASILASFKEMVFEIIGRTMLSQTFHANPHPSQWLRSGLRLPLEMLAGSRLTMELLLPMGVALCWSLRRPARRLVLQILDLIAALLLTSFFTLVAANMHFGNSCCERHELLRESWMTMVLTGVAIVLLGWIDENRRQWLSRHRSWSPLLLMLAVISLGCLRPLLHTYRLYPWLEKGAEQNFDSGFRRDDEQMSFSVLPEEGIIREEPIPQGTYTRPPVITGFSYDVYPYYLLGFFDKRTVVIKPLNTAKETASANDLPH